MKTFLRILSFARPHQKYLWISMVFNLLYSGLSIFSIITMLPILRILFKLDKPIDTTRVPQYDGHIGSYFDYLKELLYYKIQLGIYEQGPERVLMILCLITGASFMVRNLFRYLGSYSLVNYRIGVITDLRETMYKKFLALPAAFFTEQKKGDMMSRISNDVGGVESGILSTLVDLVNAPFMIIGSLTALLFLDYRLTLFTLIVFPVMGFVISKIGKTLKKQAGYAQRELGNLFSLIDETIKSNKIIKIFNADQILKARFDTTTKNWAAHSLAMSRRRELASPSSEFLGSVTMLLLTWFAGVNIINGNNDDPATFLVFIGVFYQILDPAKKIAGSFSSIQGGMASWERVEEVLDYDMKILEDPAAADITHFERDIVFNHVGFSYEDEHQVIKDFSLRIAKGESVALVGQSGSGKTTIANLLARFYDPVSGEILVDGKDIRKLKIKSYRNLIGMVTQDSVLFNDTVANNIRMGKADATMEEIIAAAKIANAHDFITALPQGYETNVGDDGGKVSGGQKQRISIARAVLKNPPIMILDEATSALDTQSEKAVQLALENMMEERTSIIIAHRLSTIQKADKILVMEGGEILEMGTHTELMLANGHYAKLVSLQNFN